MSGSTTLLDLPTNSLFKYLNENKLPTVFLPSFLHEATHFWCLATDLGASTALIELSAQRRVVFEYGDPSEIARDIAIVDTTNALLLPLLEGMALFQEFDVLPGSSNVISNPSTWVGALFRKLDEDSNGNPTATESFDLEREIQNQLLSYRTSDVATNRKINVLMQSLNRDPHCYLAGYLAVKAIWTQARQHTPLLIDREMFVTFLHSWIFQDWTIIGHVLDRDLSVDIFVYLVSMRIQERLNQLAFEDLSKEVAVFENYLNSGDERNDSELLECLKLDAEDVLSANSQQRALYKELLDGLHTKGEHTNYHFADLAIMEHRQKYMRLALDEVFIEVNKHNQAIVRKDENIESTYLAGPADEGASEGITPGWIVAYFEPAELKTMLLACRSKQAILSLHGTHDEADENWKVLLTSVIGNEKDRDALSSMIREQFPLSEGEEFKSLIADTRSHAREIFTNLGLMNVPRNKEVEPIAALLDSRGFYDLLEKDGDLLSAYARVSLLPFVDDFAQNILQKNGSEITLEDLRRRLLNLSDEVGFPLISDLKTKGFAFECLA